MHKILVLLLVIVSFGFVASCSASLTNKTDYTLCKRLATNSWNIYTEAREKEVRSRGLNCRKFAGRIDKEVAKEKLAEARATKVSNTYYDHLRSDSFAEDLDPLSDLGPLRRMERDASLRRSRDARQCRIGRGYWSNLYERCRYP